MSGIKRRSRVSTEAWRFDTKNVANEHRWSQWVDGEWGKWVDSRAYGTVISRSGDKWTVCWDVDNEEISLECNYLQKKRDDLPLQSEEILILFRKQCYIQKCMQETCFLIHL